MKIPKIMIPDYEWHEYTVGSTYTIRLQILLESGWDIGLQDYEIFDEDYRNIINQKIINHYYFKEIGVETPAQFKFRLNEAMDLIMPYYNQKYAAGLLEYDPLTNFKWREKYDRTRDDITKRNDTAESSATNNTKRDTTGTQNETDHADNLLIDRDTPETNITRQDLNNGIYASQVNTNDSNATSDQRSTQNVNEDNTGNAESKLDTNINLNTTEDYIRDLYGYRGITPTQIFNEIYNSIYNTDMELVTDKRISSLFMGIF